MSEESTDGWQDAPDLASWGRRRRQLLSALGAAGAAALAGCSGSDDDGTDTTTDPTTTRPMTSTQPTTTGTETEEIDPRFGYTATDPEAEPPVEPDHTIQLQIQPVEGREIPEFFFAPTGLAIEVGDTVKFDLATPHHNVNAYHPAFGYTQRVPDEVPPFSSPILGAGDYWLYTFEQEGVYDIMCAPHELFGMVGRIVAGSASGPGANPVGEAPGGERARPPEFTAGTVLGDDAMAPENVLDQGSVAWGDIADENKRPMLAPVEE